MTKTTTSELVDPHGRAIRAAVADDRCPSCRADPKKRIPSCGFGVRRPCCGVCGYVWNDLEWTD